MKKLIALFLALALVAALLPPPVHAAATEHTWDDTAQQVKFYYIVEEDGTASVYKLSTLDSVTMGDKAVVIPSTIEGHTVARIGWSGSKGKETILAKEVTLPSTVTELVNVWFYTEMADLSQTTLTEIPAASFSSSGVLTRVMLPNTVKTIGERAFQDTPLLQEPEWPTALERVETSAFSGNQFAALTLPDTVTYVGNNAFSGNGSTKSIHLSSSLEYIGDSAFHGL